MNKALLLIGIWTLLFLLSTFLIAMTQNIKELKEGSSWIIVISILISTAITCIIGGIIL